MRRFMSFRDFDWALLGMVLVLCTISVLEIYSATLHTKYAGFHTKQIFWIAGGLAAMFLFSKIDYHRLLDWAPWAYGVCLLALVAVKLVGTKVLGARRWIKLGPMHFQPSEWVKLILILVVARYFANLGGRSLTWKDIFKAFVLVGVPMVLVLIQPDLGTALTYTPILVAGLFLGGINLRQALILLTLRDGLRRRRLDQRQGAQALSEGPADQLHQSRQRPQGHRLPDPAIADCRRLRRRLGQGRGQRERRPRATFSPFPMRTSSLPHLARNTVSSARFLCCCYTFSY